MLEDYQVNVELMMGLDFIHFNPKVPWHMLAFGCHLLLWTGFKCQDIL